MSLLSQCPHCGEQNLSSLWKKKLLCNNCNSVYEIMRMKKTKFKKE